MDKVEKMDCGARSEVIFCAMSPLLSQSPKRSDLLSHQRIGLTGRRKQVHYLPFKPRTTNYLDRNGEKMIMENSS
jgi:hypothetical protein